MQSNISPLSNVPSEDFRLSLLSSTSGTVTITGSLNGISKIKTESLTSNVLYNSTYSFDTITSILSTCSSGTIKISCLNATGQPIFTETNTELAVMWVDNGSGYWNQAGVFTVPSAEAYCIDDITIGTKIRYDKFNTRNPINGTIYIVKYVSVGVDEDGNIPIRVLKF